MCKCHSLQAPALGWPFTGRPSSSSPLLWRCPGSCVSLSHLSGPCWVSPWGDGKSMWKPRKILVQFSYGLGRYASSANGGGWTGYWKHLWWVEELFKTTPMASFNWQWPGQKGQRKRSCGRDAGAWKALLKCPANPSKQADPTWQNRREEAPGQVSSGRQGPLPGLTGVLERRHRLLLADT